MNEPSLRTARIVSGRHLLMLAGVLFLLTLGIGGLCSLVGEVSLSGPVWQARLLRLLAAATVGAALSASGMALQGLLRNPLAEPYVLGISSGAGAGVLLGLATAFRMSLPDWATTPVLALCGAIVACAAVYGIAQNRGRLDPYVLLLSGVIVNAFNGAVMLAIFLVVPKNTITDYAMWAMGGISEVTAIVNTSFLLACVGTVLAGWLILFLRGARFNALGLGDDVARSSGVSVHRLRIETFLLVALLTAAAVALAGPVGFVGLIVPHICRLIFGADQRRLALVSGFIGAAFLMLADTGCRMAGSWLQIGEVPVGIVTAMLGGPFFIYLLRTRFREGRM